MTDQGQSEASAVAEVSTADADGSALAEERDQIAEIEGKLSAASRPSRMMHDSSRVSEGDLVEIDIPLTHANNLDPQQMLFEVDSIQPNKQRPQQNSTQMESSLSPNRLPPTPSPVSPVGTITAVFVPPIY